MSEKFSSGKMDFELDALPTSSPQKAGDDTPFCIAFLADLTGRGNRGICEAGTALANRRRITVDIDNFDKLPGKLGAQINIPTTDADADGTLIRFTEIDDFLPDRIFDRLEIFQKFSSLRKRLQNPTTFAEAAAQLQSWTAGPQAKPHSISEPQQKDAPDAPKETDSDTIERLMGKQPHQEPPASSVDRKVNIDSLIRGAVKDYIVPAAHPLEAEMVAQLDRAISGRMRAIMHHPDFKSLESAWRGLEFLVRNLETDETLNIYALDITKAELAADLLSANQIQSTGIYRLLVEQSIHLAGSDPWAILVGNYSFDQTEQEIILLARLAAIAQSAGAPFLSSAHPHFIGCDSIAGTPDPDDWSHQPHPSIDKLWQQLRGMPAAKYIGLALPRFMLRLPYGPDTEPIDRFNFQELSDNKDHEQYLWGNPAALCACLFGTSFSESGWSLTNGLRCDIGPLPMHVFKIDDETNITPCAETFLTERAMQIIIDNGLMPVISIKRQDAVKIPRFQSITKPLSDLAGRWR